MFLFHLIVCRQPAILQKADIPGDIPFVGFNGIACETFFELEKTDVGQRVGLHHFRSMESIVRWSRLSCDGFGDRFCFEED